MTEVRLLRWEDPPPQNSGRKRGTGLVHDDLFELAAELRSRPGTWAVIFEGHNATAAGIAQRVRNSQSLSFRPPGAFDSCTRHAAGTTRVYARYVGEDES